MFKMRLKRTIRDYLYDYKEQEVFVMEMEQQPLDGLLQQIGR